MSVQTSTDKETYYSQSVYLLQVKWTLYDNASDVEWGQLLFTGISLTLRPRGHRDRPPSRPEPLNV